MEIPKTKDPEKWDKDFSLSKKDYMDNKIGNTDINDLCKEMGVKPKYNFKDGYAIDVETGEKKKLFD